MEQIDLFETNPSEEWVFQLLKPALSSVLEANAAGADNITSDRGKNYTSVSFITYDISNVDEADNVAYKKNKHLAFRICTRAKQAYFGIPAALCSQISDSHYLEEGTVKDDYLKLFFNPSEEGIAEYTDFLCKVLDALIDTMPKEFDCCSRVEQCSDVKRCLNPRPDMAVGCGYRKKMKQGIFFYGKNKNT